ncbi:hypothetical protein INS49_008186 [Diaporthe citri]|uniref:uncharacterized protein n=1 Tax=Diaporthe citri TaxID=83186 RepID=UPI001C825F07|nr:uncharacterized protein INS49_008186 [Diaporthe citri]KAG6363091.1 hypothetical protein INS49_008186 [Diaporthe citri]
MEVPERKKLKLKISRNPSVSSSGPGSANPSSAITSSQQVATPDHMSPAGSAAILSSTDAAIMPPPAVPPTPTENKTHKIRLSFSKSQPSTPISETPPASRKPLPTNRTALPAAPPPGEVPAPLTMTKAGRTSKPTAKKRAKADPDSGDEARPNGSAQEPAKKKMRTIKLKSGPDAPSARRNSSFRIAIKDSHKSTFYRENGSGYDSEMEDAEEDPIVEEQIVLRMMEGPECDYINACLDSKKFPSGGMDFKLRWLNERRAVVTVQGRMYAAVLVDMPTITEGMKTWDKKLMVKSADISQMLLVFARVNDEASARTAELPKVVFDGHRWPHGLTPPMHDAVHRRFRKRLHKSEILNKEQEVQRLLQEDKNAISTRYEWIDERRDTMQAGTPDLDAEGEEDAEGEIDDGWDVGANDTDMIDAEIEAQLEAELNDLGSEMAETPTQEGATPAAFAPETPAAGAEAAELKSGDRASVEGESGEDYDDDDDDSDDDANEEEKERREQVRGVREDVRDIEKQINALREELASKTNSLLRKRIEGRIKGHMEDRQLKLASIGELPPEDQDQDE